MAEFVDDPDDQRMIQVNGEGKLVKPGEDRKLEQSCVDALGVEHAGDEHEEGNDRHIAFAVCNKGRNCNKAGHENQGGEARGTAPFQAGEYAFYGMMYKHTDGEACGGTKQRHIDEMIYHAEFIGRAGVIDIGQIGKDTQCKNGANHVQSTASVPLQERKEDVACNDQRTELPQGIVDAAVNDAYVLQQQDFRKAEKQALKETNGVEKKLRIGKQERNQEGKYIVGIDSPDAAEAELPCATVFAGVKA